MNSLLSFGLALSIHSVDGNWNTVHPFVEYGDDLAIGAYYNSESAVSVYASYTWHLDEWFLEGGAVTGYSGAPVLPFVRAGYEFGGARAFVAPALMDGELGLVLGLEVSFGKH